MSRDRVSIAILFSIILSIVGFVWGYWYGSQINWLRLNAPPEKPGQIVGLGVENSPEGYYALVIQTVDGNMYYYRESGGPERWVEVTQERVRWIDGGSEPCGAAVRSFIPPPPGKVIQCLEYAGYYAQWEPEVYIKQWVLLDDGSVWKWSYPPSPIYAIIRRNILFGLLGLLAGGLIGAGTLFAIRGDRRVRTDNIG